VRVPSSLSPEQRRLRAQIAANTRWSREDPRAGTARARAAWYRKFLDQVDPDRSLAPAERDRRVQAAVRAEMQRLALRSSKARAAKVAERERDRDIAHPLGEVLDDVVEDIQVHLKDGAS
jgi:hypothetical protein